jgi:hypothetical protein
VPAANTFASHGFAATQHTFVPRSTDSVAPGWLTSHSLNVQSSEPDAKTAGCLGEYASDHTRCVWSENERISAPASESHSVIALCGAPHESSCAGSAGLHARQLMRHCAASLRAGVCTLHTAAQLPVKLR